VILMAATAWLMLSFSSCIVCGFNSYTVLFCGDTWKVQYTNQIRTRYRNWRTSATQLQPSKSLSYIGCTSTWWRHDCWLTVQTLCAIYILTSERISQGHVQNGSWATFSWPILYLWFCHFLLPARLLYVTQHFQMCAHFNHKIRLENWVTKERN
jgi:hypothetical protein